MKVLAPITLACAFILVSWATWSVLWPFEPLNVEQPIKIAGDGHVRRGELLNVELHYCKEGNLTARMESSIQQDGRVMLLTPQWPVLPSGCHIAIIPLIAIPEVMALESTTAAGTGRAIVEVRFTYHINALRDVTYSMVTDEFLIDP